MVPFVPKQLPHTMPFRTTLRVATVLSLFLEQSFAESQCYWPNHNAAFGNYTACNAAAPYSSCCRASEVCMTNGLCLQTQELANRLSRGACTDQTFSSTACPKVCDDSESCFEIWKESRSTMD